VYWIQGGWIERGPELQAQILGLRHVLDRDLFVMFAVDAIVDITMNGLPKNIFMLLSITS
jgi:hypothetical protein